MIRFLSSCVLLCVIGCGGSPHIPRLNGSTQEAYEASLDAVRAELQPAELEAFDRALPVVAMAGENLLEAAGDQEAALARGRGRLDGMTAAEVLAKAEDLAGGKR